jgi:hypothetical protein
MPLRRSHEIQVVLNVVKSDSRLQQQRLARVPEMGRVRS